MVAKLERTTAEALQQPMSDLEGHIRTQHANVDETSWREAMHKAWLWVIVTPLVTVFHVAATRCGKVAARLLGSAYRQVVTSDRWKAYNGFRRRQFCWSHLKRDFQAMVDRDNAGSAIGAELLLLMDVLFAWWHRVRDGTLSRRTFRCYAAALREDVLAVLEQGRACGCARTAAMCRELLAVKESLWTFVRMEGVEPTNNHIERMLRLAVLWRKKSFGSLSESGCRFVERPPTVAQTRRLQGRPVLRYLYGALVAHRSGRPAPSLLSAE
jgi:transposase